MKCLHKYYKYIAGQLYCSECGKSLAEIKGEEQQVESKELKTHETKADAPPEPILPAESKRISRVEKKGPKRKKNKK